MVQTVYQVFRQGDHRVAAEEILSRFPEHSRGVRGADIREARGTFTVAVMDDPSTAMLQAFRQDGWSCNQVWQRA